MTVERMIELLEIEKECVLRNASAECNRYCAGCDLLQDDTELHEMYTEVIVPLQAQKQRTVLYIFKAHEGTFGNCPACGAELMDYYNEKHCGRCGQAVKWE